MRAPAQEGQEGFAQSRRAAKKKIRTRRRKEAGVWRARARIAPKNIRPMLFYGDGCFAPRLRACA
jgi:hypothetical protein